MSIKNFSSIGGYAVDATEYPPIDEKFLIDIILDYPRGYLYLDLSSCESTSEV